MSCFVFFFCRLVLAVCFLYMLVCVFGDLMETDGEGGILLDHEGGEDGQGVCTFTG